MTNQRCFGSGMRQRGKEFELDILQESSSPLMGLNKPKAKSLDEEVYGTLEEYSPTEDRGSLGIMSQPQIGAERRQQMNKGFHFH